MNIQKSYLDEGKQAGKLYLVATPIGNLEDMTYRAVRILSEVQWIAAEDTRQTRKLLTHYEISAQRLISYHEHNKQASEPELLRLLLAGDSIALVSDAGLPAICDPGADLVAAAVAASIDVVPIPGANAALSALIMSGISTERFTFVGFLPRERNRLEKALLEMKPKQETLLCYESPHRLLKTLQAMQNVLGSTRFICLVRELTKKYEEAVRGSVEQCLDWLSEHPPQGEYVIVISGADVQGAEESQAIEAWWQGIEAAAHAAHYEQQGLSRKEALKQAAADRGISRRDMYKLIHGIANGNE